MNEFDLLGDIVLWPILTFKTPFVFIYNVDVLKNYTFSIRYSLHGTGQSYFMLTTSIFFYKISRNNTL